MQLPSKTSPAMMGLSCVVCTVVLSMQLVPGFAQMNSSPANTTFFLPVTNVGSNDSGTPVPFYGCINDGATLQQLSFWANSGWIRGLEAKLTDGRALQAGCLNVTGNTSATACSDASLRNSNFTFQSGERIVNLTLYPGFNGLGQPFQRAGGLNFTTSMGRYFSFGMTNTWQNGTSIDVGSGIPCGLSPKAGADVDALGFIFLREVEVDALMSVQYSGVSAGGSGDVSMDVTPLQESANELVLSNQTYNNSGKTTSLVASFTSQANMADSSRWTYAIGLDSYLMAPVNGPKPQVVDYSTNSNISWTLASDGLHSRSENSSYQEAWNYTLTVGPQGASQITAGATQGNITATFTASLNVTVDSGASFSVPVSGLFLGVSTGPVHVNVQELAAAQTQATSSTKSSSSGGGHSNTVAWVVGVLIGLICGLILAVLLAYAYERIRRRRNKRAQNSEMTNNASDGPAKKGWLPAVPIPAFTGKGKGVTPEDVQKDVELGTGAGKGKWVVDNDPKYSPAPVMGVPMQTHQDTQKGKAEEGELPEDDGKHVLPYNMFRRLRLESIRRNLRGESPDLTPVSAAKARLEKAEKAEKLSNPPSGASTPHTIPEMSTRNAQGDQSSDAGAESIEANSEPEVPLFKAIQTDDKVPLSMDDSEDDKEAVPAEDEGRRQRMKDQIAQRMSQRRSPTPERPRPSEEKPLVSQNTGSSSSYMPEQTLPPPSTKVTLMDRISKQVASYRSQRSIVQNPSGLNERDIRDDAMKHEGQDLKLGAGYRSAEASRDLEKNTLKHGDDRIRLGVKYETQGRNE